MTYWTPSLTLDSFPSRTFDFRFPYTLASTPPPSDIPPPLPPRPQLPASVFTAVPEDDPDDLVRLVEAILAPVNWDSDDSAVTTTTSSRSLSPASFHTAPEEPTPAPTYRDQDTQTDIPNFPSQTAFPPITHYNVTVRTYRDSAANPLIAFVSALSVRIFFHPNSTLVCEIHI